MRPVARLYGVSQPYGVPGDYAAGFHTGTDFACPVGTRVRSPWWGTVTTVGTDDDYGNYVIVTGLGGRRAWLLAHLSSITVHRGQRVRRGQRVGLSGNTGNTTGPHLHAEERHPPFGYRDSQPPTAWHE